MRIGAGVLVAFAALSLMLVTAASAEDEEVKFSLGSGGLKASTADGQFKIKIGGRIHADGTFHAGDQPENTSGPDGNVTAPGALDYHSDGL